ncbi:MAG: hypothetical protein JXX29_17960 [Deltaproteobacteria bacterium]|nr:hypothetical protein [Deltaproteobacteria bacterium]MBN2673572.1 hypothetical protein [Deltaproteobacteria bacterium]
MKTISKILFLVLIAALMGSCEESTGPAFVYGHVSIGPGETAEFHGKLSTSGAADVYGSCKVKDGKLDFTVGHASKANIDGLIGIEDAPTFISISQVTGPNGGDAAEGVFDLSGATDPPEPNLDPSRQSTFYRAEVKNEIDSWDFMADSDNCRVNLFAVPIEGEVIFENDLSKSFDYYVNITCANISLPGESGETLRSVNLEFYFENCS